ncbi:hypothetical protein Krac_7068 [Ktedonobacter racemifer DSM 44963]|uniref:Uncharacterized protein n=1 Tax=Ktedonobacter racemifer DSM 44963 TaxID=485913 RepID=D6TQV2_KTERA|nr:hypothetical protein Krac_7068 [Ktedonobacter racemifer DSM 44963]
MRPETLFGEHEIFPLPSQNDPASPDHFAHTVSSSTQLTSEKVHHSSTERTLPLKRKNLLNLLTHYQGGNCLKKAYC